MSAHSTGTTGFVPAGSATTRSKTPDAFRVTYQMYPGDAWVSSPGEFTTNDPEGRANGHAAGLVRRGAAKARVHAYADGRQVWVREDQAPPVRP